MASIFLSYRTDGDGFAAAAIYSRLEATFGAQQVFRDRESMSPGTLYPERLRSALGACTVLIAIIGPRWLNALDESGRRRINNSRDWVRTELRVALTRPIPVIPVLLDDTPLPHSSTLPTDIAALALSQSWQIRNHSLSEDTDRLIDHLTTHVAKASGRPGESRQNAGPMQINQVIGKGPLYAVQNGTMTIHTTQ